MQKNITWVTKVCKYKNNLFVLTEGDGRIRTGFGCFRMRIQ